MSSSDTTAVYVHQSRFPLRVLKHLVQAGPAGRGTEVKRLDALFRYEANAKPQSNVNGGAAPQLPSHSASLAKGKGRQVDADTDYNERHTVALQESGNQSEILTFESPIEGTVTQWCVQEGQYLTDPYQPVVKILEPCKHPVQLGGLCAVCGKDLTSVDYTGFRETSRASISMSHDTAELTVSLEEASRIENQTTSRLRKEKKLSLIVDLDQTIIHATVDPTVGDWMFDEKNPNYPVLRDVQRFKLLNDEGKEEGCWYYVKPRPTLPHFLEEASKIYELHVYTMGTRQYAENVCRIIDPDGRMFANRILSRDESGSLVRKSLERLFPVDQSMVVIIDDRADIWEWSPHLVKVVPYDFFVGIGDINSAFLPKQTSALASTQPDNAPGTEAIAATSAADTSGATLPDESVALSEQIETLDHQIVDKPLAKMQEEKSAALHEALDHAKTDSPTSSPHTSVNGLEKKTPVSETNDTDPIEASAAHAQADGNTTAQTSSFNGITASTKPKDDDLASESSDGDSESDTDDEVELQHSEPPSAVSNGHVTSQTAATPSTSMIGTTQQPTSQEASSAEGTAYIPPEEEAVLHDDDFELERILDVLGEIHRRFYDTSGGSSTNDGVQDIIPQMKSEVLHGCNIVFSGVIPLDKPPEATEVWQLAEQFGATCTKELSKRTTHVIAARKGTSKVNSAQRRRDISIVTLAWLLNSVNLWRRQPESAYLLDAGSSPQHSDGVPSTSGYPSPSNATSKDEGDEVEDDAHFDDMDWGDAEAEIQAFLEETDDEDSRSDIFTPEEDSLPDTTAEGTEGKKRTLSATQHSESSSPLAKRRRVAAARVGRSKLKMSESADTTSADNAVDTPQSAPASSLLSKGASQENADTDDDDLDDFAKALEGELQ